MNAGATLPKAGSAETSAQVPLAWFRVILFICFRGMTTSNGRIVETKVVEKATDLTMHHIATCRLVDAFPLLFPAAQSFDG